MSEYISKTELKQELKKHLPTFHRIVDEVIDNTMTFADVAPVVHAHWCEDEFDVWCSHCMCAVPKHKPITSAFIKSQAYCHSCGAKMDESEK